MGQRSASETVVRIFMAFLSSPTWRQPDELARHAGISVNGLRRRLDELTAAGVPLERSEESPTEIY